VGFARWENLDTCSLEMQGLGHDSGAALKICRAIKERADSGMLLKAGPVALKLLSKADDVDIVLAGYASWEVVDDEGDVFTVAAQVKALQRFLGQPAEYQNITVNHGMGWAKEFKLAQPLLTYTDSEGTEYFTHVNEKGTYLIVKVRPSDGLKATEYYREKAKKGEMNGFSVTVLPLQSEGKTVTDMEYHAITVTEKGVFKPVNPMTRDVKVISKSQSDFQKAVEKRGSKWCVVHCSGADAGQVIKCFDSEAEAQAMHAAIQANKKGGRVMLDLSKATVEDIEKQLMDKYREKSSLERLLYPLAEGKKLDSFEVEPEPVQVDPAAEAAKEELRNRRQLLNIEIWALEDALREKVRSVNKAQEQSSAKASESCPESAVSLLEIEGILAKYGFTHCK